MVPYNTPVAASAVEPNSERELVGIAQALGALRVGPVSRGEKRLLATARSASPDVIREFVEVIRRGGDPLGEAFCRLRAPAERRPLGATYTPQPIIDAMIASTRRHEPARVVDPGAGSGRFLVAAGRAFPRAKLIAVEKDPLAALLCRAHLAAAGHARRSRVENRDFLDVTWSSVKGRTLFVGNPPYVRHHDVARSRKRWLSETAASLGLSASQLAGLHVYFALRTATLGRPGDYGTFVTAAEWLDVNYGSLMRALLTGRLGVRSLHLVAPTARVFADAEATAVITCFELGAKPTMVRLRVVNDVSELGSLSKGRDVPRERLAAEARWTPLFSAARRRPSGFVELGELCRVHRGQATGANRVWIAGSHSRMLPDSVLYRTITRARELFAAGDVLSDVRELRRVIDLPAELDAVSPVERKAIERFLTIAKSLGADRGFIATHRRAWWAVGLREPAPILATYMARRPPAFVRNPAGARHINVAHGLYPRDRLSTEKLDALARYLGSSTRLADGRTYSGGLTKFEPKEMERLLVPAPSLLAAGIDPTRADRGKLG
ncbi:MAG TPA: N-6 DNA methylase [Polyangiaceae bacterium]